MWVGNPNRAREESMNRKHWDAALALGIALRE
jgi:hypothetical protein